MEFGDWIRSAEPKWRLGVRGENGRPGVERGGPALADGFKCAILKRLNSKLLSQGAQSLTTRPSRQSSGEALNLVKFHREAMPMS